MNDNVLEIRNLQVVFSTEEGELRAVDGVNLDIRRGRITAIVGESGCGKSVTSFSILRLIQSPGRIAGGSILYHPRNGESVDLASLPEDADRLYDIRGGQIGMIFQEPMTALSPVHTVGNQLCEAIRLHHNIDRDAARSRAIDMLGRVGIPSPEKRIDQYPFEMSGGMRQRVVIAMALVCHPDVLIADEPTTALDVTIQAQIMRLIKDLQSDLGTSTLIITHDLGVVGQLADEVAVMYLGRVVEQGSVRDVMKRPRHPYTIGLLKSLPSLTTAGRRLPSIEGTVPSLNAIPPGCPFHPRCPFARPGLCDVGSPPEPEETGEGQSVACLRWKDVAKEIAEGVGHR